MGQGSASPSRASASALCNTAQEVNSAFKGYWAGRGNALLIEYGVRAGRARCGLL